MSYSHPPQGYYGDTAPPTYHPTGPPPPPGTYQPYPPNNNSYDLPPRGGPGIQMPPPPHNSRTRLWLTHKRGIAISLIFWLIFLLIDLFGHHFPTYPWSARRDHRGRTLIIVIYIFVFQVFWLLYIGGRTAWDVYFEMKLWWNTGQRRGVVRVLGMVLGAVLIAVLVGFPAAALALNASVAAKRKRD